MFRVEPMKVYGALARIILRKLNLILNHVGMNAKNSKHLSEPARYLLNNENHYATWKILSLGHADFH